MPNLYLFRKQPRHPSRGERRREGQPQRCTRAGRCQNTPVEEGRDHPTGLTIASTDDVCGLTARKFAPEKDGFKNGAGFWRQTVEPDFFFDPHLNAGAQLVRSHQPLHERHLVNTSVQKEARELSQALLTEIATPIEIIASGLIASRQMRLVTLNIAGKPARDGLHGARIQGFEQRCM